MHVKNYNSKRKIEIKIKYFFVKNEITITIKIFIHNLLNKKQHIPLIIRIYKINEPHTQKHHEEQ